MGAASPSGVQIYPPPPPENECKNIGRVLGDIAPLFRKAGYNGGRNVDRSLRMCRDANVGAGTRGFKGIKGQMFFNMLVNVPDEEIAIVEAAAT